MPLCVWLIMRETTLLHHMEVCGLKHVLSPSAFTFSGDVSHAFPFDESKGLRSLGKANKSDED